jgi:hypothetical protein
MDSADRHDHARFSPHGFRLKEQKLQLNGQPRDEDTESIRVPVEADLISSSYRYRRRRRLG